MTSKSNAAINLCRFGKIRPLYALIICLMVLAFLCIHQRSKPSPGESKTFDARRSRSGKSESHTLDQERPQSPGLTFNDEQMILEIRANFLIPPSSQSYNLKQPEIQDPSRGQSKKILEILKNQKGGFFVECGALDGETRSNTLFMERNLGWQGVLIEADPKNFRLIREKNRHAWTINVCLNDKPTRSIVRFEPHFNVGKIHRDSAVNKEAADGTVEVLCYPLHTILLALNRTRIDYFSLDVEGAELDVLRNVPFDQLDIRTMSVEYIHTTGGGKPALRSFLEEKGYTVVAEVTQRDWTANDFIVVKNSAFPELVASVKQSVKV